MTVYSFFLNVDQVDDIDDFDFMIEHSHCLKTNYKGFHPVIKSPDGTFKLLYAMTTSKKRKDIFMMTRNMKLFTYYKSDITTDKFKLMKNNLDDLLLIESNLIDVNDDKDGCAVIPTIITKYEYEKINDEFVIMSLIEEVFRDPDISLLEYNILEDKLKYFLNHLKLRDCVNLLSYGDGANDCDIEYYTADLYSSLDEFMKGVRIKTFEIFIHLFGNTMK